MVQIRENSGSHVDKNALVISEVSQRRLGRLVKDDRKATVTQITIITTMDAEHHL